MDVSFRDKIGTKKKQEKLCSLIEGLSCCVKASRLSDAVREK